MNRQKPNTIFTKNERRGIILLSIAFIISVFIYFSLDGLYTEVPIAPLPLDSILSQLAIEPEVIPEKKRSVKRSIEKRQTKAKEKKRYKSNYSKPKYPPIQPFTFDPNSIAEADLRKMKLAPYIVKVIINYRNRGGVFRKKEDLKKIYGVSDSIFSILEPYVEFAEVEEVYKPRDELATISFLDLNSATAKDLESLHGIGPTLSKRIVKFREKLGGFHKASQFTEVYGVEDSVYQRVRLQLSVSGDIVKININTAEKDQLAAHPYISYKLAKIILNYRKQHGPFKEIDELMNIKILKIEDFEKIKPYLSTL